MEGKDGKTEKATPKRRKESRDKGEMAVSQEINTIVVLVMGLVVLRFSIPFMVRYINLLNVETMSFTGLDNWSVVTIQAGLFKGLAFLGILLGPIFAAVVLGAVIASMAQTGPFFNTKPLEWKWSQLNPAQGFKQLISAKMLVDLFTSILKISVISLVLYLVTRRQIHEILSLSYFSVGAFLQWLFMLVYRMTFWVLAMYTLVAAIDWVHKKYTHEKKLLMTKQEVKDERKQQEPSSVVRKARSKKMRELTLSRMMAAVPDSTVVITNPTHVAVVLKYDPETMDTPKVVAKGLRLVAERIKRIARENEVPVLERPELARSLYKTVEVGRDIPSQFYEAIAQVLAYLQRLGHQIMK